MTSELLIRALHFLGMFLFASMLLSEAILIKPKLSLDEVKRLSIIDLFYGLGAAITLICGILLWLSVGKPAIFYTKNFIFHIKMTLFVLIGFFSIFPTIFFLKQRKSEESEITVPSYIKTLIYVEIAFLCTMPFLAVLIARGVGLKAD